MSPTPLPREGVAIRELRATEWQAYRTLRLRALVDAPDAFSTRYAQAAAQPDEYWEERLAALSADADLLLVAEEAAEEGHRLGQGAGRRNDHAGRHARQRSGVPPLYESVGFQPVGESEPLRPNSTLRAQTMRLDISAPTPNA